MFIYHYSEYIVFHGGWAQPFVVFLLISAEQMPFSHSDGLMMVIIKSIGVSI